MDKLDPISLSIMLDNRRKQARTEHLTCQQISNLCGVSVDTLLRWEKSGKMPRATIDHLLFGNSWKWWHRSDISRWLDEREQIKK